jgi:hypothetical protein
MIRYVDNEGKPYLVEGTPALDSIKNAQRTKPSTDDAAEALAAFMKLNSEQKKRHLEFLQASLSANGNDAWKSGEYYSERNRQSLKNAQKKNDMPTLKKEIAEAFPEFTPELQERFAKTFAEGVAKATLANALTELFAEEPHFHLIFAVDEEIDAVEALANRVLELEESIAFYDQINEQLREEQYQDETAQLYEEFILTNEKAKYKPYRRSHNIADDLGWDPDPDNIVLMESDVPTRPVNDPMSKRVAYLERTSLGRPIEPHSSSAQYLVETWDKAKPATFN